MASSAEKDGQSGQLNGLLRRALATPPISNEDILKRSKESHRK